MTILETQKYLRLFQKLEKAGIIILIHEELKRSSGTYEELCGGSNACARRIQKVNALLYSLTG